MKRHIVSKPRLRHFNVKFDVLLKTRKLRVPFITEGRFTVVTRKKHVTRQDILGIASKKLKEKYEGRGGKIKLIYF